MRALIILLLVSLAITSCKKDLPDLPVNYLDINTPAPAGSDLLTFADTSYTGTSSLYEYYMQGHYKINWDLLKELYPGVSKLKFYMGNGYNIIPKDSTYYFRRYVRRDSTYCISVAFMSGTSESRPIDGPCFTVPH